MQQGKIDNQKTFDDLVSTVNELQGQKCWGVTRSYGGVYNLDFGEKVKFGSSLLGVWWVSTCGTNFIVSQEQDIDTVLIDTCETDLDEAETIDHLKSILDQFMGKRITNVQVDYDSLSLLMIFDNTFHLKIVPTEEDEQYEEPFWSIKFPNGKLLAVGSGRVFSYYG